MSNKMMVILRIIKNECAAIGVAIKLRAATNKNTLQMERRKF